MLTFKIKNKPTPLKLKTTVSFPDVVLARTEEKQIKPTTEVIEVTPSTGYDGLSKVTIKAVTNEIDNDIKPENIKEGINILDVEGTVKELIGEEINVIPSGEEQIITPSVGKTGITKVIVDEVSSDVDENIIPDNIKAGVSILGVKGNLSEPIYIRDCTDLFSDNNRSDELESLLSICKPRTMKNMFMNNKNITNLDLSILDTSENTSLYYMCRSCTNLKTLNLKNIDTSKVTTMSAMCSLCSSLVEVDISDFKTNSLNTNNGTNYMFQTCTSLKALIINNPNLFPMTDTNMLIGSKIANGTGYVYVPDDMVETYKTANNWSTYANQIKPISELPV